MVSYIKTQWFRCLIGCVCLGLSIYYLFQPGADESTLEGLEQNLENAFAALCFLLSSIIWFIVSILAYSKDRIELLEKRAEKYDALCEEVNALYEANRIDREYMRLLEQKINQLKYDMTEDYND